MDLGGAAWTLLTIGALLLVAVLLWAEFHNKSSRGERERSEKATHDLYDQEEAARRRDDGEV